MTGGPCRSCGVEHTMSNTHEPGTIVVVVAGEFKGRKGKLREKSIYGGPMRCRIEFEDGRRENFDPCMVRSFTVGPVFSVRDWGTRGVERFDRVQYNTDYPSRVRVSREEWGDRWDLLVEGEWFEREADAVDEVRQRLAENVVSLRKRAAVILREADEIERRLLSEAST